MSFQPHHRKPFRYTRHNNVSNSSDPDSDTESISSLPTNPDDQEQESYIQTLRQREARTNRVYSLVFMGLPVVVVPVYVLFFVSGGGQSDSGGDSGLVRLLCLLCVTSLSATCWDMYLFSLGFVVDEGEKVSKIAKVFGLVPTVAERRGRNGPVGEVLPYLNIGICGLLALASWRIKGRVESPEGFWVFLLLPAVIYGVISVVKQSMKDVGKGILELNELKYNYKGA